MHPKQIVKKLKIFCLEILKKFKKSNVFFEKFKKINDKSKNFPNKSKRFHQQLQKVPHPPHALLVVVVVVVVIVVLSAHTCIRLVCVCVSRVAKTYGTDGRTVFRSCDVLGIL